MLRIAVVLLFTISFAYGATGCPSSAMVAPTGDLDGFTSMKNVKVNYNSSDTVSDSICRYLPVYSTGIVLYTKGDSTKCPKDSSLKPTSSASGFSYAATSIKVVVNKSGSKDGNCAYNPVYSNGLSIYKQ